MKYLKSLLGHLSKNILLYTLVIITCGIIVSLKFDVTFLSRSIFILVFFMIYPMMVNISFSALRNIKGALKPLLIALFINFLCEPFICYFLCDLFNCPKDMKIALVLLSVAPPSIMGLGYVGLSKGNMISASVIVSSAFKVCLLVYPIVMHILGSSSSIIPFSVILKTLFFVLFLPLIFGVITREIIEHKLKLQFDEIKPLFSLITISCLYFLVFVIFALKGRLIFDHYIDFIKIAPITVIFYFVTTTLLLLLNKFAFHISYEDNQAIFFTTIGKNVALTIGLLTTAFGPLGHKMAMYPAIISIFQIIFLMSYLHFSEKIAIWWKSK